MVGGGGTFELPSELGSIEGLFLGSVDMRDMIASFVSTQKGDFHSLTLTKNIIH